MEIEWIKASSDDAVGKRDKIERKTYRVAAYCRVSTDAPEQKTSYDSQISYYRQLIDEHDDWRLVDIFADEAITGTKSENRPGFQKLIEACRSGEVDLVITKSISRFARNTHDVLKYVRELQEKHISIIFEEENINTLRMDGELILSIISAVYQQEVENISQHVKKGLRMKMQRGELVGYAACLGYDYDIVNKKLSINETEAETVRYIFKRYLEGIGATRIAKELEAMGLKTKRGSEIWAASTVNNIIRNEKYVGDVMQGKTYIANPITKKRLNNKGEHDKYHREDAHEAIISREDFAMAQEIRTGRGLVYASREAGAISRFGRQYSFSHMIECGYCGENYVRRNWHAGKSYSKIVWQCGGATREGRKKCPNSKVVTEEELEQLFVSSYNTICDKDNNETLKIFEQLMADVIKKQEDKDNIEQLRSKISTINKKISKLLEMRLDGIIVEEDYKKQYDKFRLQADELEKRMKSIEMVKKTALSPSQRLRGMIESVKKAPQLTEFNRKIFEAVINKVVIGGSQEDGTSVPSMIRFVYVNGMVHDMKFKGTSRAEKKAVYEYKAEKMEVNEERAMYDYNDELTDIQKKSLNTMRTNGVIDQAMYNKTAQSLIIANRALSGFAGG